MLLGFHVPIYDVIFAAHKNAGRSIKTVGRSQLTTGNLNQQICARIGRFTPFSNDMIEAQVQLIIRQHLTNG